ncbi:ABC transporter permease [Risungbinella massiliensis]|uniref:ABC transporter permease n=1 Tax=Risungbinella massiliensis TaxID=1329796 RepID=UPI0005CC3B3C|nr:ABC transporter permease [Risungbinella massiliensis]
MKQLIRAEWERLWKRRITWIIFALIPVGLFAAATYFQKQNEVTSVDLAQYAFAGNFPVLGLAEMLFTLFNAILLVFITLLITEEYRSGQLRMVMIRTYSFRKILLAKVIVLLLFVLSFFVVYFCLSYSIGFVMFDSPEMYHLFYHDQLVTLQDGLLYNLLFYGVSYLTVVALICVLVFIAVISKTTTTAIGGGLSFLLISFSYPMILEYFSRLLEKAVYMKIFFSSIPMIQWQGITMMLAESPQLIGWNLTVLGCYIVIFSLATLLVVRRKDSFY